MKGFFRRFAAHAGLFCGLLALLYLALVLSALLPNAALHANFAKNAAYYRENEPFPYTSGYRVNSIADNYADAILLSIAWHMGAGESPFLAALDTAYHDGGGDGVAEGLYLSVAEDAAPNTPYTRYWHGGALFARLFHLFTDVHGMKTAGLLFCLCLTALTAALLIRKGHGPLALCLLLSLAAVQFWHIRLSLEYQSVFLLALLFAPLSLFLERRGDFALSLLFTAAGLMTAFFDFLTAETLTLLLPLLLTLAMRAREGRLPSLREGFRMAFLCCLCWALAYAGAFVAKWAAASLATGENAFIPALGSVAERVGAAAALGGEATGFFSPLAANLTALFNGTERVQGGRVLLGLLFSLGAMGSFYYLFRDEDAKKDGPLLLLALGVLPLLRFLALSNHAFIHCFFTHRALAATVFALLAALMLGVSPPAKAKKGARR